MCNGLQYRSIHLRSFLTEHRWGRHRASSCLIIVQTLKPLRFQRGRPRIPDSQTLPLKYSRKVALVLATVKTPRSDSVLILVVPLNLLHVGLGWGWPVMAALAGEPAVRSGPKRSLRTAD